MIGLKAIISDAVPINKSVLWFCLNRMCVAETEQITSKAPRPHKELKEY